MNQNADKTVLVRLLSVRATRYTVTVLQARAALANWRQLPVRTPEVSQESEVRQRRET